MKKIQVTIGDYDISKLEEIFEGENNFQPTCPEDQIIIEIMRQCIDPENIIKEEDEQLANR